MSERVTDERLEELIIATDMRGRYEPAEYCKRIDSDTAAALRELRTLRASPVARTEGEADGRLIDEAWNLYVHRREETNAPRTAFNDAVAHILSHLPPRVEPAATIPSHGYEIVDGDDYGCTWAVLRHGELDAKCSSHRDAMAVIASRLSTASPSSVERLTRDARTLENIANSLAEEGRDTYATWLRAIASRLSAPGAVEGDGK